MESLALFKALETVIKEEVRALHCDLSPRLDRIAAGLKTVAINQELEMTAVTDLQAAVAAEDTEIAAAVVYIQGVPALVAAAVLAAQNNDAAALATITADINTQAAAVAAALAPAATGTTPPAGTAAP